MENLIGEMISGNSCLQAEIESLRCPAFDQSFSCAIRLLPKIFVLAKTVGPAKEQYFIKQIALLKPQFAFHPVMEKVFMASIRYDSSQPDDDIDHLVARDIVQNRFDCARRIFFGSTVRN